MLPRNATLPIQLDSSSVINPLGRGELVRRSVIVGEHHPTEAPWQILTRFTKK